MVRPGLTVPWVLVTAMTSTTACEPSGATRIPGGAGAPALNVPYPVADAERIEGAGRQALRDAQFVFIGGTATGSSAHVLAEPDPFRLERAGPVLIAHHIEPVGADIPRWQQLRRRAFGRVAPPPAAVAISADDLVDLDLGDPPTTVWLVGTKGTCRATVGSPLVGAYQAAHETLAIGYRLEGCPSARWAQIGIVSDSIPVDFRWVPAAQSTESTFPYGQAWDHPLAAVIDPPGWSRASDPELETVLLREIPGVKPRVIQLHRAWLADAPEDSSWCEIDTAFTRADGFYNERWLDEIPWDRDAVGPYMLGAFVNGAQVDAVLYDDRLDGLVVVPPGPLDDVDDPDAWRQVFVPTGRYDPQRLAAWGIEPARGPEPTGPPCAPLEVRESEGMERG